MVWSDIDVHVQHITKNDEFLTNNIKKAETFFRLCALPELFGKWFTRSHSYPVPCSIDSADIEEEDEGTWCYCQENRGGEMIGCDSKSCTIKWFHMACLQMLKKPKVKHWLCPTCHAISTTTNGKKRKRT